MLYSRKGLVVKKKMHECKKNSLLTIRIETAALKPGSPLQQSWFKSFVFAAIYVIEITFSSIRVDAVPLLGNVDPQ
jgi:hypothetical protein